MDDEIVHGLSRFGRVRIYVEPTYLELAVTDSRRVLVISPHLDDAVLSIGATLARLGIRGADVQVCTMFAGQPTGPLSAVARAFHKSCGQGDDSITLRRDEDRRALSTLSARTQHLKFLDAVYRRSGAEWLCNHDRAMFDSDLPAEPQLSAQLSTEVLGLLAKFRPDTVMTCAAIGGHVDHGLTRDATLSAAASVGVPTLLWEDLPYAVGTNLDDVGGVLTIELSEPDAWERKRAACAHYQSQLRMLWGQGVDWWASLRDHACTRGAGVGGEVMWLVNP